MEELLLSITRILTVNAARLKTLLSTSLGWLTFLTTSLIALMAPYQNIYIAILIIVLVDTICALFVVRKTKRKITSAKFSDMFIKVITYCGFMLLIQYIEKAIGEEWFICLRLGSAFVCVTELWSIFGNMTILKPNFPIFAVMKKFLLGEIANKLHCGEEEVEEILNNSKTKKK